MLSGLAWLDPFFFFFFGSTHLLSLHWSCVGHNIKRQASFPLQQACVLKTGDKKGSGSLTERDGNGGGYQKIIEGW